MTSVAKLLSGLLILAVAIGMVLSQLGWIYWLDDDALTTLNVDAQTTTDQANASPNLGTPRPEPQPLFHRAGSGHSAQKHVSHLQLAAAVCVPRSDRGIAAHRRVLVRTLGQLSSVQLESTRLQI
jgi:hypothetical protein